jgi:exonuclease SbcC
MQISVLEKQLKSAPSVADLQARLASIDSLEAKLKAARKQANEASDATAKARRSLDGLSKDEEGAWAQFGHARDGLAHLKPPAAKATDLAGSWQRLVDWGATQVPLLAQRKADAEADSKRIENEREALIDKHIEQIAELGYEIDVDVSVNDQIAQFVADARATLKQITGQLNRKSELETLVGAARQQARTAEALAQHLKADRFERWLLEAAFERLVAGASEVLQGLSSGAYSFAYNKKLEFEVVDHANADETRSARTLSGGETFLASLALALTLADQVGDLAVEGAARLESMFLDEGFGSLDLDTLEVVATAIEELGSRGRMFGLVTHVPELAERVPVQYRVTKGPATSTVERVAI